MEGALEGKTVGCTEGDVDGGALTVGAIEGLNDGLFDGWPVGCKEYNGLVVGVDDGYCDGVTVGTNVGERDGSFVGLFFKENNE